jgi:hypothetical protein
MLGLFYAPSCSALITGELYSGSSYWPLLGGAFAGHVGGYVILRRNEDPAASPQELRTLRAGRYAKALKSGNEPSYEFCRRFHSVTLMLSLIFALFLPLLLVDFYRVAFNFFCVVYGFLLVVHLLRVALQNLSAARINDQK